ncbi:MAG: hypothetical protein PHT75_02415 [Bacilli bacterium]|nr:hypothetical protein [Bacilli bacterium]MDD3304966.1 hypothetical protein [Bacilli bacterium]MDD4054079.1 hypothetical protein [Bacilli bacterium]MDD4411401.1 hypothetical protein [Bacilli bacterium]
MNSIIYLLWAYLVTVGLSCTGIMLVMISMKKELKQAGYEIDFDALNSYEGPFSFKEIRDSLKITPFIPVFNLTEMGYYMKAYIYDRESVYLFLSMINAIKEINSREQEGKVNEDEKINEIFKKLVKWYQITMLSNNDILDKDLEIAFDTLDYIKHHTNDNELLDRVYKFEQELVEQNIIVKNNKDVNDIVEIKEPDKGYSKVFKKGPKK